MPKQEHLQGRAATSPPGTLPPGPSHKEKALQSRSSLALASWEHTEKSLIPSYRQTKQGQGRADSAGDDAMSGSRFSVPRLCFHTRPSPTQLPNAGFPRPSLKLESNRPASLGSLDLATLPSPREQGVLQGRGGGQG